MRKLLFVISFVLLGASFAAQARVPIGTIAGTVLDSHDKPVPGAAVTIQTSDGSQPYAAHTDSTGHFQIDRIETGQYDLRASHSGLISDWTKRIMVHANKTTSVTLRLPAQTH
jgi:protocatechuate 3,4-dioxygenase beta subunit